MSASRRLIRRREAKRKLDELFERRQTTFIIHYACESFKDPSDGFAPRIASIAIRNLDSGQTKAFSIHKLGALHGYTPQQIQEKYDILEKEMLDEFNKYIEPHLSFYWIHWSMRDTKFGFAALEERYRVLNGNPIILPRVHFFDLPRILQDIYGKDFASHPRMTGLRRLNTFKEEGYADDFMEGVDEAAAFKNGEFVKLYNSTLKKVDVIAEFAEKAYEGTLKTNYSVWKEFGFSIPAYIELAFENIWFKALTIMGVILSFIQALISFFKQST